MSTFNIIHQSIIDLYVDTLTLSILEERINDLYPDEVSDDIKKELNDTTKSFASSIKTAESLYGSPDTVQHQLDIFTTQRQGDA